jgi:hypothetical protein
MVSARDGGGYLGLGIDDVVHVTVGGIKYSRAGQYSPVRSRGLGAFEWAGNSLREPQNTMHGVLAFKPPIWDKATYSEKLYKSGKLTSETLSRCHLGEASTATRVNVGH